METSPSHAPSLPRPGFTPPPPLMPPPSLLHTPHHTPPLPSPSMTGGWSRDLCSLLKQLVRAFTKQLARQGGSTSLPLGGQDPAVPPQAVLQPETQFAFVEAVLKLASRAQFSKDGGEGGGGEGRQGNSGPAPPNYCVALQTVTAATFSSLSSTAA